MSVPAANQMICLARGRTWTPATGWAGVHWNRWQSSTGQAWASCLETAAEYLILYSKPGGANGVGICDGKWHRLSILHRDSANSAYLFLDGAHQSNGVLTSVGDMTTTFGMIVGSSGGGAYDLVGEVTDIRVWDIQRIGPEIRYDMHESISDADIANPPAGAPDYTHLVGYWPCNDDDEGTDVADHGSGGNDGTASSADLWTTNSSYGKHVIDAGTGSKIDIDFVAPRFHGHTFNHLPLV